MSRANPQAAIGSEEQLVPRDNRLKITKNTHRISSYSNITDSFLRLVVSILKQPQHYQYIHAAVLDNPHIKKQHIPFQT
nr:hypothetical protein [Tanacetum cinerariifolium]